MHGFEAATAAAQVCQHSPSWAVDRLRLRASEGRIGTYDVSRVGGDASRGLDCLHVIVGLHRFCILPDLRLCAVVSVLHPAAAWRRPQKHDRQNRGLCAACRIAAPQAWWRRGRIRECHDEDIREQENSALTCLLYCHTCPSPCMDTFAAVRSLRWSQFTYVHIDRSESTML